MSIKSRAAWLRRKLLAEARYGVPDENKKRKNLEMYANKMRGKLTAPEQKFRDIMDELGISYENQKIHGGFIYDFYLPDFLMFVEVDGDYYHANPEVFAEGTLNRMQKKNQKNDVQKTATARAAGYRMERVWEKELNEELDQVKKRFKQLLK